MTDRQFTPGPFRLRPTGAGTLRLYSASTGQTVAFIISEEWGDYDSAPDGPTALGNSQLFRFAPEMLAALEAALDALNTAPRFAVSGHGDSYRVAARLQSLIRQVRKM